MDKSNRYYNNHLLDRIMDTAQSSPSRLRYLPKDHCPTQTSCSRIRNTIFLPQQSSPERSNHIRTGHHVSHKRIHPLYPTMDQYEPSSDPSKRKKSKIILHNQRPNHQLIFLERPKPTKVAITVV